MTAEFQHDDDAPDHGRGGDVIIIPGNAVIEEDELRAVVDEDARYRDVEEDDMPPVGQPDASNSEVDVSLEEIVSDASEVQEPVAETGREVSREEEDVEEEAVSDTSTAVEHDAVTGTEFSLDEWMPPIPGGFRCVFDRATCERETVGPNSKQRMQTHIRTVHLKRKDLLCRVDERCGIAYSDYKARKHHETQKCRFRFSDPE